MRLLKIRFNDFFDRSISTRSAIENIFAFDKTGLDEIILDFSDIVLISASAAHQIIIETRKLESEKIKVNLINLDNHIYKMLELSKTDRKNIMTVQNFEKLTATRTSDLSRFLLSFQ
jgi:anti-anti-sigma regulatory factor